MSKSRYRCSDIYWSSAAPALGSILLRSALERGYSPWFDKRLSSGKDVCHYKDHYSLKHVQLGANLPKALMALLSHNLLHTDSVLRGHMMTGGLPGMDFSGHFEPCEYHDIQGLST